MPITFAKAVKHEAKGRIALIGPAGSGKSFTMLTLATLLAGPSGKIAAVDTEQGSLEKYAHTDSCGGAETCKDPAHFDFDVCPLADFTAPNFLEALRAAEKGGYAVFCCDSLSHFWMGKGGTLEFVDDASKRSRDGKADTFAGWKEFRPLEREMTDAMITSPCHVICTMRVKTAYEEQIDSKGKKKRVKIGLAPVQRDGLEYEFDLVGSLTEDNVFIVDKTRCSEYSGKAIVKPKQKDFEAFSKWLSGAPREMPKPEAPRPPLSVEPTKEDFEAWKAEFDKADTIEKFNETIVPLMKERSKQFLTAAAMAAKGRGYISDRSTGLYLVPLLAFAEGK